ncbi:hypothetical protein SAMN04515617_10682 [Collimonas sp. OK242]|uniref:hypothetical protein n=1 Tax=Collimonas sp. OK242 TaxID=1798195 RepID=UPI00089A8201|nr:hypothetical protein [Collimonas sp. OK242]SDX72192.1 hypothetical protein SAMN04515617_10682 [Collimonas sp. OK242]
MSDKTAWPAAAHPRAMSVGILLSLLFHIGLMHLFWPRQAADVAAARNSQAEITLLLLPAAAPVARVVTPPAVQRGSRLLKSPASTNTITQTLPPAPRRNSMDDTPNNSLATEQQPRVDLDAALKTARQIAIDPKERRNGTAVAQLQTHPLEAQPDSRLARDIQRSARTDCKDFGQPFGLIAPLVLAADAVLSKKDGGCKW